MEPPVGQEEPKAILEYFPEGNDGLCPHLHLGPQDTVVAPPHALERDYQAVGGSDEVNKLLGDLRKLGLHLLYLIILEKEGPECQVH